MNTFVVQVIRGRDSKLYPARPLTSAERNEIRWREHHLVCRDGLSVRAAQKAMLEQGVRRSVGSIARDLKLWQCPRCAEPGG